MGLLPITSDEIPEVVRLMNTAYRGTGTDRSWNSEAGIIEGDRITETTLREDIAATPQATMLLWRREGTLLGCFWVEPTRAGTWYLSALTVDPGTQKQGLGRTLLQTAEEWIVEHGGTRVEMSVLNVRGALLAWYGRRGYQPTGEIRPFPYGDNRFGKPLRDDLAFLVLAKPIA